jgi:hypothetical protein
MLKRTIGTICFKQLKYKFVTKFSGCCLCKSGDSALGIFYHLPLVTWWPPSLEKIPAVPLTTPFRFRGHLVQVRYKYLKAAMRGIRLTK